MAKRIDNFRDSVNNKYGVRGGPSVAAAESSTGIQDFLGGIVSDLGTVVGASMRGVAQTAALGSEVTPTGQIDAMPGTDPLLNPEVEAAANRLGTSVRNTGAAGLGVGALPILALDAGYRGLNTGVGGTTLLAADYLPNNLASRAVNENYSYINPLARDGFQWDDVFKTYRQTWGNEKPMIGRNGLPVLDADGNPVMEVDAITAGQAISTMFGKSAINLADSFIDRNLQEKIDAAVLEDTQRAILDPSNERGLFSWMSGLHSEFNIYNMQERESAFNQGAGRWISGTADAAVQWWLAPEVLGLKAAGIAGRSLFMKSLDELADIEKARESIELHRAWKNGDVNGKQTDFGRLLDSLVKMDETQVVRHQLAKRSTDAALVARAFGSAKTFDEAADRFLALSGDMQAIDRLFEADKVLGDSMRMNVEQLAELRERIDEMTVLGNNQNNVFFDQFINRYKTQADRIEQVLVQAKTENKSLETAIAGLNKEAGIPDVVRFGDIRLSRLKFGPNSAARMEAQAVKEANRAAGRHLWKTEEYKTGGAFGRTVRVWQSAGDYMRTNRIRGFARLTDSNDVIAEMDASIQTLPMFRTLQKEFQGAALLPGTDQLVSDFREEIYSKLINARTPTERMNVWNEYEDRVWNALRSYYNINEGSAANTLAKYKGLREVVVEVAKAKGFIVDNGEVNIIPELQTLLAEGMPTMDFHFIETIFRLDYGSGVSRGKDWMSVRGSRGLAAFDAIWRPLVLLRLGYTARNIAEGTLRDLAAFGTISGMYQTNMGTRAIAGNPFFRWANGFGRGMDRIVSMRRGSLRRKRQLLEASQAVATKNMIEVRKLEAQRTAILGRITAMADKAEERARRQILAEAKESMKARVGTTWEEVTTEAYGEMDEIVRQSSELIIATEDIRPLMGRGVSGRRSNIVTGFEDQATAEARLINAEAASVAKSKDPELVNSRDLIPEDPAVTVAKDGEVNNDYVRMYLSGTERSAFDELWNSVNTGQFADGASEKLDNFYNLAIARATRQAMRNGDHVVRVIDPESGLYQIVHSPSEIMADDIASGNLAILPKENVDKIKYVRANVYGGSIDLRKPEVPTLDGLDLRISTGEDGIGFIDDPTFAGSVDDLARIYRQVFPGQELGISYETAVAEVQAMIRQMEADPQLAEAVVFKRMAMDLPEEIRTWMEESGYLIPNKKLKSLAKAQARTESTMEDIDAQVMEINDSLRERILDGDYWMDLAEDLGFDPTFHTGFRIGEDILEIDPVKTDLNVNNLLGVGFYMTRDPQQSSGYFFTRVLDQLDNSDEAVIYAIPMEMSDELRYLDVDVNGNTFENEEFLKGIFDDMVQSVLGRQSTEDDWAEVDSLLLSEYVAKAFPLSPFAAPDTAVGTRVGDFMFSMQYFLARELSRAQGKALDSTDVLYEAQMAWVNALRKEGYEGIRHTGGGNIPNYFTNQYSPHDVFIAYGDGTAQGLPELIRVDDLSDDMMLMQSLMQRYQKLENKVREIPKQIQRYSEFGTFDPKRLNAATMPAKMKAALAEYMKQFGVGRIILDDAYSPSGYSILTSPDMISVSTDQIDAVLPPGLIGKDFVDNKLPQLEQQALVRNPATLTSGNLSDTELLQMFDGNQGVVNIIRGTSKGTPQERALLARQMEMQGYSHVQIGGPDSNMFTTASELVGQRATGAAYGAMIGQDAVAQRRNLILANSEDYAKLEIEFGDTERLYKDAEERFQQSIEMSKKAAEALKKRLGKRGTGEVLKAPLGSGEETFTGNFDEFTVDGPFNVNNQGSLNAALASSGDTMMANLYGFTDYAMLQLRKSQMTKQYVPGDSNYFDIAAEQINRLWRNDLIGMSIIRGESDEVIMQKLFGTKQGRAYLRDVEEFRAFKGYVDADRLTEDAREDLAQLIVARRESFNQLVPDDELRRHLIDNEVTPIFLQSELGWRADLPTIVGSQLVGNDKSLIRKMTGAAMQVLGTMPENALVRHPFFRARWRDEMQRQADLYASQGVEEFSEAQLNAMNQVAKRFALKQTNETLYTIQRLSTPAHIFKFVMPFFPAWASAMRFWLLRMPVEQPQNIARYAMAWNAPESAGWVYDQEGNKIPGKDNILEKVADKAFGGSEGSILIRVTNPALRDKYAAVTGGNTDIRIPKGSLDMMLQGETFWFPGLTPFAAIPASWLAAQMPDVATAFETGKLRELPLMDMIMSEEVENFISDRNLTRPFYRALVPFGRPTQDKDLVDVATSYIAPAAVDKFITAWRGMDSAEFASAAKEIHRTKVTEWELNGMEGPEPDFLEAVGEATVFYMFRGGMNLTMPFATQFQTKYQFYIDEGRRIDRETFDAGGTYADANKEFLRLYGPTFFKYTQSLSAGGSGMSSTVGEFNEFKRDPQLMADLASIGEDASFITMATRPFAEAMNENGFDGAVYSWQMNRNIEGALGKYLRGGQTTELPTTRANRELGWMYHEQNMEVLNALAAEQGVDVSTDPVLSMMKKQMVDKIAARYPEWFEDYNDIGGSRFIRSNTALQAMKDNGYFEAHKDLPYAQALGAFYEGRKVWVQMLQQAKASGGSASLDAKSNIGIKMAYLAWVERLRKFDPTGNFGNTWERFFESDPLLPIPALEVARG